MYICMYVCVHVCMCVCISKQIFKTKYILRKCKNSNSICAYTTHPNAYRIPAHFQTPYPRPSTDTDSQDDSGPRRLGTPRSKWTVSIPGQSVEWLSLGGTPL